MERKNITQITGVALLMAMVVVMQFISASIPPVSGFSISLVLIPIVLGAAIFGAKAGGILGLTFGVVVLINCITGADVGGQMVFQANPLLCALVVLGKGTLAGLAAGGVYKAFKNKHGYVAMILAAIVCPVVNTGTFVLCMLTFFKDVLAAWAGGGDILAYILSGLLLMNFVPELMINLVFSPAGQRITQTANKKL